MSLEPFAVCQLSDSSTKCEVCKSLNMSLSAPTSHHIILFCAADYITLIVLINHLLSTYIHTHKLFNGPWSGTIRVGRYQKKHSPNHTHPLKSSGFCGTGEDNGGRGTDSPGGHHPIRTNGAPTPITPHFYNRMPFLPQPSQIVMAWDRLHRIMLSCIPGGLVFGLAKSVVWRDWRQIGLGPPRRDVTVVRWVGLDGVNWA